MVLEDGIQRQKCDVIRSFEGWEIRRHSAQDHLVDGVHVVAALVRARVRMSSALRCNAVDAIGLNRIAVDKSTET